MLTAGMGTGLVWPWRWGLAAVEVVSHSSATGGEGPASASSEPPTIRNCKHS